MQRNSWKIRWHSWCRIKCVENEDNHKCCLECPYFDDCPVQCELLDEYEFVENCPDYVKEEEE